jgi:two-component sensor histidine kinase
MSFDKPLLLSQPFLEKAPSWRSNRPLMNNEPGQALARAIVDTIREPLLVLDNDLRVVLASRSFYMTFKTARQDVQGISVFALADGQWNIPELRSLLQMIVPQHAVMEAFEVEQDFVGIGRRTMRLNARKVFYEGNSNAMILLAIDDVTGQRAAEREMNELLREKEVLLQEMQHRVANSLQIIASILLLKARTVRSEETRLHLRDAHQRVMSVAAVQQQLQASRHQEPINVGPYLSRLCESLAGSMIGENRQISITVRAEEGTASSSKAVSIGLIVAELVINALKHASFKAKAGGEIVVAYDVAGPDWRLTVSDNGTISKPEGIPKKPVPGLGTSIIKALAKQLEARVRVSKSARGTTVSVVHAASIPRASASSAPGSSTYA